MNNLYLPKAVEKIIVLDDEGPLTIHRRRKKKRKTSRALKPMRKLIRTMAKSQRTHADEFLSRADRSDSKKRNGSLRDLGRNHRRAARKGAKVWRRAYT